MLRIFISGKLTDGADTERGFPQCTAGLAELQLFYNSKKSAACTFLISVLKWEVLYPKCAAVSWSVAVR